MPETVDAFSDVNQEILKFSEKVFRYSLQKFGIIYKELAQSPLFNEDIGNAVVILQIHIRDFLRDHLFRAVEKMIGAIDASQRFQAIQELLDFPSHEHLEGYSTNTLLLGYLALIAEIIIFMDCAGIPAPLVWFAGIWTDIYDKRLKQKFAEGWEDLRKSAIKICDEYPNKVELFQELKFIEHPYAEIDPRIVMSFKEQDPIFMLCTLATGFEFPRKHGLSRAAVRKLLKEHSLEYFNEV